MPRSVVLAATLAFAGAAGPVGAQIADPDPVVAAEPLSFADRLDDLGRIHLDPDHPFLQEFWVLGRYHGQYHWAEGSAGSSEGYETRRSRSGFQARLFDRLTVHAQMVSGTDYEPFYNGFTELWARWAFRPGLALTVGQQKHRFTHDRNVSSRYINYLERALLTNQFGADYTPAVTLSGDLERTTYYAGVFSNATGRDIWDAFTELDSGQSWLAAVYHDLDRDFGADHATVHFTAVHSEANDRATNLNRFDEGLSTALILTDGPASLVTEVVAGFGGAEGGACGLNLQPAVFLTDTLQAAFRYQLAGAWEDQGLSPQRRYERPAGLPAGDLYQAFYAGLNHHVARHRLKVMTGVEYATLGGEDVWTASTMFRFYFGPHTGGAFPMNQTLRSQGLLPD
jgi:hypothetical protein